MTRSGVPGRGRSGRVALGRDVSLSCCRSASGIAVIVAPARRTSRRCPHIGNARSFPQLQGKADTLGR
jgi:hypothetical protein